MKLVSQHISAFVLVAFVVMITDLTGLYGALAGDETTNSVAVGCHSTDVPSDWEHDEPCSSDSVVPCHFCAILIVLSFEKIADEISANARFLPVAAANHIAGVDPDPPKTHFL